MKKFFDRDLNWHEPENDDFRVKPEGWILIAIAIACVIVSGVFLVKTIRTMNTVQMANLVATPATDFLPAKRAARNYNGLVYVIPKSVDDKQQFDTKVHLKSFDYVWSKIKETYWEKDFGGVDWDQARAELRPQVEKAKSIQEVRKAMNNLISRLGKSHFAIIPGKAYQATQLARRGTADSGLHFRLSDDKIFVTHVRKGSDAEKLGVKPGWQIVEVGDTKASEFLNKAKQSSGVMRLETLVAYRFGNAITGPAGSHRQCKFLDHEQQSQNLEIGLSEPPGRIVKFGNLPGMRIDMETKLLDSNVGYFRFNGFFDPVRLMPEFRKAVKRYQSADGLIIDIRGNGGGVVGMTMGMASPLTAKPAPLGVMKMKNTELKLALFKSAKPYQKKIAVLVDEASASASEIYAGGLQDLKIARVFGQRTAGLSLPSTVEKLPNGDRFQYAIANYISASGKILEGNGVVPDETIKLTQENLTQEIDPVLKSAVQWIHVNK